MALEMLDTPRATRVGETTLAWTEAGSGPPLLLLHGLGDCHRTWRRVLPLLAPHHRVLLVDLPGHGLSGRPDAPYTLAWYAETLRGFLDALELERVQVVGHSFGGGVAQWMLLDDPQRIERLVLVAPGGLGREVGIGMRLASFPVLGPLITPVAMRLGTRVMMRVASSDLGNPEPNEIDRLTWMNSAPGSGRAFTRTVSGAIDLFGQYLHTWDRIHEVPALPPLMLHWGTHDRVIPIAHGLAARDRLAGAELLVYPGVGHFPHLDQPAVFSDAVRRFVDLRAVPARPVLRQVPATLERRGALVRFFVRVGGALRRALRQAAA
ncbi:MAG: alpha/beta fold hydrolase [Polyangiaceae bacterium]|nr:alpha/beta fold hydrolase [Polyangiaceae bacterium]MCL4752503.1 alpha/beta fold hydrolase [Myxococcales bacterium]